MHRLLLAFITHFLRSAVARETDLVDPGGIGTLPKEDLKFAAICAVLLGKALFFWRGADGVRGHEVALVVLPEVVAVPLRPLAVDVLILDWRIFFGAKYVSSSSSSFYSGAGRAVAVFILLSLLPGEAALNTAGPKDPGLRDEVDVGALPRGTSFARRHFRGASRRN